MAALLTFSCISGGCRKKAKIIDLNDVTVAEEYHADNDIAMTVKSIADAISVGEPLDSSQYNFEGILTDGQGMPLYTDIQGNPGGWSVRVIDNDCAEIRNLYLGDLLHTDLVSYIEHSLSLTPLKLTPDDMVFYGVYDGSENADVSQYDIQGGKITIRTSTAEAPNGLRGPLMKITLMRTIAVDSSHTGKKSNT